MGLISPTLPDVDIEQWRALPRAERTKVLARHWAQFGFGTPQAVYVLYVVKIALYVLGAMLFIAATPGIGSIGEWRDWWTEPVVFQKVIIWTLVFEVLGFGCGFGPLTLRFLPPIGTFLYWLRPGTIRLPPWPDRIPGTRGDTRTIVDVLLYAAVLASAVWVLISPADRTSAGLTGAVAMIEPARFIPVLVLLPLLGLRDKTIFLAARSEHYWVTGIVLLFPFVDMIVAAKLIMIALWWGAATSKLNQHFPFVISAMLSNAPLNPRFFKRWLWRDASEDLRPSKLSGHLAHGGTVIEYLVPLVLLLSSGGTVTKVALVIMVLFHLFILASIPLGVPLEWNIVMIFGAIYLFGEYAPLHLRDAQYPVLVAAVFVAVVAVVIYGNLRPSKVSFLPAMRYYAGNWATSAWLFAEGAEQTYADKVTKAAQLPHRQLAVLYTPEQVDLLIGKMFAWRGLHSHGRALAGLYPHAAEDHESRFIMDGELLCGSAIGWNFADGHLHDEQLLAAIQHRCQFEPGQLRVIMLESQPLMDPVQQYRIVDAATGLIERGEVDVSEMTSRQPTETDLPFRVHERVDVGRQGAERP